MSVRLDLTLTEREADAVLAAIAAVGLSLGWGVRKSQALQTSEMKIVQAISRARADR